MACPLCALTIKLCGANGAQRSLRPNKRVVMGFLLSDDAISWVSVQYALLPLLKCVVLPRQRRLHRESGLKCSTYVAINEGKLSRIFLYGFQRSLHDYQKIRSKSRHSLFVPCMGLGKIPFGLLPQDQLLFHPCSRILFLTSSHGDPASGSR